MNLRKLVVTLAAAALLPTLAHADASGDSIRASFDRDLYAGYFVESLPGAKVADPLEAYFGSINLVVSTKQANVVDPQDVWSGAAYYPYAGIEQANAADPHEVYYGTYSYASPEQANAADPHDAYYGSIYPL